LKNLRGFIQSVLSAYTFATLKKVNAVALAAGTSVRRRGGGHSSKTGELTALRKISNGCKLPFAIFREIGYSSCCKWFEPLPVRGAGTGTRCDEVIMKKMLFGLVLAGMVVFGASAADRVRWPVWFAFNDTEDIDVIGLRFNLPSGHCEQVTGMDFGFIGRSRYYNGIQLNLFRNDVTDALAGWQIGCYNSTGLGDALGLQTGLWNQAQTLYGVQAGLVNVADYAKGFQIGLINRAEDLYGFQIGLINVIRSSDVPFCPIVNIGF